MNTIRSFVAIALVAVMFSCTKEDKASPPTVGTDKDTTITNVSYGNNPQQVYDIHLPAGRSNTTPVVLMIHGGAWKEGNKEELNPYVSLLNSYWEDVAVVNMNYRLASDKDDIHHDEMMDDISAVIGHLVKNQNDYQISTKMGIMGASAGGQLAMIYAYRYNDYKNIKCVGNFFGPSIINDWSWYSSFNILLNAKVGDILTLYVGEPWNDSIYGSVSPYWNITESTQPTIIFHGNIDPVVPVYQSQWMHSKLRKENVPTEYHEYLAFHGFDQGQNADAFKKLVAFFKLHMDE